MNKTPVHSIDPYVPASTMIPPDLAAWFVVTAAELGMHPDHLYRIALATFRHSYTRHPVETAIASAQTVANNR